MTSTDRTRPEDAVTVARPRRAPESSDGGDRFDVFVSFAEADRAWVQGYLLAALDESGVRYCTRDTFPLGMPAVEAVDVAVEASRRVVLVLSPASLADHGQHLVGVLASHYGGETASWPVVPLLLGHVRRQDLPLRLRALEPLDVGDPQEARGALTRLVRDLGRTLAERSARPDCPYRGMQAFQEEDERFYVGREAEIADALAHLRLSSWLFVVGPSGCGKSSLVRAGLVPRLRHGGSGVVLLRPGADPLGALGAALDAVREHVGRGAHVVLVVDQLEELFTLAPTTADPLAPPAPAAHVQEFWQRLAPAVGRDEVRCVATVRADFYPQLMGSPLWPTVRDQRLEVVPLSGRALARAILAPAEAVRVFVETSLVDRLVDDAAGQPGALPFVQETLVLLWERLEYRYLPVSAYNELVLTRTHYGEGPRTGLQVAMADRADAAMAGLPSDEARRIARRTFVRLVQFVDGRDDVRRQLPAAELQDDGDDPALVGEVLRRLIDAHLLTPTASVDGAGRMIDLSHEALISGWPALHAWVAERRAAERVRRDLEASAQAWQRLGGGAGGLLDESELREADRWLGGSDAAEVGRSPRVSALLGASREALRRAQARRRRVEWAFRALSGALALLLVLAVAGGITAVRQRDRAEAARAAALSGELSLRAATLPGEHLDRALLLSQEAVRLQSSARSRGGLLAALRSNPRVVRVVAADAPVGAVETSPDGRLIAFGDSDGLLRVVESGSGRDVGPGHRVRGEVRSVAFSPDGSLVAAASSTGEVQQWPVGGAEPVGPVGPVGALGPPLTGHTGSVRSVRYSPDGRWVATGGIDGRIVLHDRRATAGDRVLTGHRDWVQALEFSADGRWLVSGGGATEGASRDSRILVWEVRTGRVARVLQGHTDAVRALALAPDGHTLASAGADRVVRLWDLRDGSPQRVLAGHADRVFDVAFLGPSVLASAGRDHEVRLWDPATGREAAPALRGHGAAVRGLAALPGARVASAGSDGRLFVWAATEPGRSRLARPWTEGRRPVWAVAAQPGTGLVATGDETGTVTLARLPAGSPAMVRLTLPGPVWGLAFGPGVLASTTYDGLLQVWDTASGRLLAGPVETGDESAGVAVSADGSVVATGGSGGVVRLWDASLDAVGAPLAGHRSWVRGLAFRPSDGALVTAGADGVAWLWRDVTAGAPAGRPLNVPTSAMTALALSPDGRTAAIGDVEGDVVLWDADATGARRSQRQVLAGRGETVTGLGYAAGGTALVSTDATGSVRLWDVGEGYQAVGELGRGAAAHALAADGTDVVTGTAEGPVAWDLALDAWRRTACEVAGRNLRAVERAEHAVGEPDRETCPGLPTPGAAAVAPDGDG